MGKRDGRSPPVRKRRRHQQITAGDVVASCRQLPDASTLDYERRLQKIATIGVVQLFNAISQHSKQVQTSNSKSPAVNRKRIAVSLDMNDLMAKMK
ncbi:hypothetical protein GBAR_LOCUS24299 [Geodia barretti]|uniref:RRP15-like protein n=1 Tax=Geodia barretti TaxID=519541 RepID=A0AA35TAL1_GEOBA|nr:hypothetical protein GBAR_LOCUS24299 [Geodia barretti]